MAGPMRFFLLRGLYRESAHWGSFLSKLQNSELTESVVAMDLPGTGANRDHRPDFTLDDALEFLARRYHRDLNYPGPRCFIGISLGGMIGYQWLKQDSSAFNHAVIINASFSDLSRFYDRLTPFAMGKLLRILFAFSNDSKREHLIHSMVSNNPADENVINRWVKILHDRPIALKTVLYQLAIANQCSGGGLPPVTPGLILCSAGDRMVDASCSQALASVAEWPISINETAGHELTLDDPDWVIGEIEQWLGKYGMMQSPRRAMG